MLFWRFGPQWAVRRGDWKLVRGFDYAARAEQRAVNDTKVTPAMLFNLRNDIGETKDLAAANPDKVRELQAAWDAWNAEQRPPRWIPQPKTK